MRLPLTDRADPGHRRRLRRSRLRHRLREDHAGARLQRLRSRPAPQPAADQHLHARCAAQRQRAGAPARPRPRREARKRVLADSTAAGLLERIDKHKLMVPRGDRSGAILEPLPHRPVVRAHRAAGRARHRGRGERAHPLRARELVRRPTSSGCATSSDWCISRQLWWGHQHSGLVRRRRQCLSSRAARPRRARRRARSTAATSR